MQNSFGMKELVAIDGSLGIPRKALLRFPFPHPSSSSSVSTVRSRSHVAMASASPSSIHTPNPNPSSSQPSLMVFSGGTAFNGVVEELKKVTTRVAHVLPVSDDGGSTAEIVRVLGGPAVGDIRSRCLRLSDESTSEALAVRRLLGHRLPLDAAVAKLDWYEIVEGGHCLWNGVSEPYRETIRAFLAYFQNEILRRSNASFCFSNGSIGNFFFAGARIFFQSLDASIFLFSRVSEIPRESLVLPVISTNDRLTLGCELWDGTVIRGQNEISHPSSGRMGLINKDCTSATRLPSGIKRVFYMSSEGSNHLHELSGRSKTNFGDSSEQTTRVFEDLWLDTAAVANPDCLVTGSYEMLCYDNKVFPAANPTVLEQLRKVDCIVYGMGSLFTSICPSLVLHGIGEIIASRPIPKVLLLNGSHDRETSSLSASSFVTAITDALNRTHGDPHRRFNNLPSDYINALLVPKDGQVPVDFEGLAAQGIFHVVTVDSINDSNLGIIFDPRSLIDALTKLIFDLRDSCLMDSTVSTVGSEHSN